MEEKKEFDLSRFLPDSLSLQENFGAQTKRLFPAAKEDSLDKLLAQDPYEVLGETTCDVQIPAESETPIQEFFRGKNVFITGGTGFIGKVLVEKLIRSVPNLGHIYLIIRAKRGKTFKERLDQLLEGKVFRRMKAEVPLYYSKVTALEGDLSQPDLGLSAEDRQLLSDKIHVVFHSAADVRFVESLRNAIDSNVFGTKRLLDLSKTMKHLKSFVHVSTAYSNCVRRVIEEKCYKMNWPYKEILSYIESNTDEEIEENLPRILQGWPNTYSFSKAICEEMVEEESKGLPLCIYRPSVVVSTYREPFKGWTDNLNGPLGLMLLGVLGLIHAFRLDLDLSLNLVPVDCVVNSMIAVAWETANQRHKGAIPVYNYTSSNPPCWKTMVKIGYQQRKMYPFEKTIWYCFVILTKSKTLDDILHLFLHKIPGLIIDNSLQIFGIKSSYSLTKIYEKFHKAKNVMCFFTLNEWQFRNENMTVLWNSMSREDQQIFNFDISDMDLKKYFLLSKLGIRYYFLKEDMQSIPASKQKLKRLKWAHYSLLALSGYLVLQLLVNVARILPF